MRFVRLRIKDDLPDSKRAGMPHPGPMSRVKPSAAQRAQRKKVKEAAEYYRRVLQDPVLLKRCRAVAKSRKIPLPAAAAAEFFKAGRTTRRAES